jgi:hypothetical protein
MNENIKAGADIHAGDGGYSIGTQEKYDEFAKVRNQSLGKMRIKELAEQADKLAAAENKHYGLIEYSEKFAELIVQECANELLKWKDEPFPYDPGFGAILIKSHFGIK